MNQRKNEKLTSQLLATILQEVYDSVPDLMHAIAPIGWKQTSYHQEMNSYRKMLYDDFMDFNRDEETRLTVTQPDSEQEIPWCHEIDIKEPNDDETTPPTVTLPDSEQETPWYDDIDFESYFAITFPPLYHDHLELYYILSGLLLYMTANSTLYRDYDSYDYYFDDIEMEELIIKIAYQNKQIEKEDVGCMLSICPYPQLEDMDLFYCLKTLFSILKKHRFHFNFWDDELLLITELQETYQHILYRDLHYADKEKQLDLIQLDIQQILERYGGSTVDPHHLPSIISFYNRKKISPLVLSYLHVYDKFPWGYPYRLTDYEP